MALQSIVTLARPCAAKVWGARDTRKDAENFWPNWSGECLYKIDS